VAEQLLIGPSRAHVKLRSPLLPFITLGIYHLVWWYRINRELRDAGHAHGVDLGQSPTSSLLALFPGALIIIPPFVSYWRGTNRVIGVARLTGTEPVNGWIALILFIVIQPAYWAYLQSSLNKAWKAAAREPTDTPVQGAPPPPAMAPAAARDELAPTADRGEIAPAGERAPAASAANASDTDTDTDQNSTTSPRERDPSLDAPVPADPDAPAHEQGGGSTPRPD
jgi:hypothetical protein